MARPAESFELKFKVFCNTTKLKDEIKHRFIWDGANIGLWPRIRILYELLSQEFNWTAPEATLHLQLLLQKYLFSRNQFKEAFSIKPDELAVLFEKELKIEKFEALNQYFGYIQDVWSEIGSESFLKRRSLVLSDRKFLNDTYGTYAELEAALTTVFENGFEELPDRSAQHDVADLPSVADFAAMSIDEHQKALDDIFKFVDDSERSVYAVGGSPATGKSGLFKAMYSRRHTAKGAYDFKPIFYFNMSEDGSIDAVLNRLIKFTAKQESGANFQYSSCDSSTAKIKELSVRLSQISEACIFIFTNIDAIQYGNRKFRIRDDRVIHIIDLIVTKNPSNKVLLGILPSESVGNEEGGRSFDWFLEPPSWSHLEKFTKHFYQPPEDTAKRLRDILRTQRKISSTVIIAALALLSFEDDAGKGMTDATEKAIKEALNLGPSPIIQQVVKSLACDAQSLIALAFIAFSNNGLRENTLILLLRYHRHFSSVIRNVPINSIRLARHELADSDQSFITEFRKRFKVLIGGYKAEPAVRSVLSLSLEESEVLHITTGLRAVVAHEIEVNFPDVSSLVHKLLAREKRREGMRARLANISPPGGSLEEIRYDLDVAAHLLASCKQFPEEPTPNAESHTLPSERLILGSPRASARQISSFVLHEIVKTDAKVNVLHSHTVSWLTDDEIQEVLSRFFYLGRSVSKSFTGLEELCGSGNIPSTLLASLPVDDIALIVTTLGRVAYRLQDFNLLWQMLNLEGALLQHNARGSSIQQLQLLKIDTLISMGAIKVSFSYRGVDQCPARELVTTLLSQVGGVSDLQLNSCTFLEKWLKTRAFAARYTSDRAQSRDDLHFRMHLLLRMAELSELSGLDGEALQYLLEAEAIDALRPRADRFPVVSGELGRKMLRLLVRLAASARLDLASDRTNSEGSERSKAYLTTYRYAKTLAEEIHRRNIRRLAVMPSERLGVLIDEALLERHLRGSAGLGNLKKSYMILKGDQEEMVSLTAPRHERLEYFLERARAALLKAIHDGDPSKSLIAEARTNAGRAEDIFSAWYSRHDQSFKFLDGSMGLYPLMHRLDTDLVHAHLIGNKKDKDDASENVLDTFEHLGFRTDTLFDLAASKYSTAGHSWFDDPRLP